MSTNTVVTPILHGYAVTLRPVNSKDLEMLRIWRNLPEINQHMLSQEPISSEQQMAWFKNISRDKSQMQFVIEYKDKPIGAANIKSRVRGRDVMSTSVIEPGLYLGEQKYRNNIIAFAPTLLLNDYCFKTLKCPKLRAVVKADNNKALNYNINLGYRVVSKGDFIEIELNFEDYQSHTQTVRAMLSRGSKYKGEQ